MLDKKVKILFWLESFPNYSETFINNQIIWLLKNNYNVLIYGNNINYNDFKYLDCDFDLRKCTFSREDIYPNSKKERFIKSVKILSTSVFSKNLKFYSRALQFKKYGYGAKSLKYLLFTNFLIKNKVAIVHAHFGPNGLKASIYKDIGLEFKLICTFHGYDIRLGEVSPKNYYSLLFNHVCKVISISEYNHKKLLSFGLASDKSIRINNGVQLEDIQKLNQEFNNEYRILSVGRLVREKGYDLAFEALSYYKKSNPLINWHYDIIGDGVLELELRKLAEELGLKNNITFHLYQDFSFIKQRMLLSDFLLLSSVEEALPTVILEAFSQKLPVLATNVGGVSNVVKTNYTGCLVSPNVVSIYEGIEFMIIKKDNWKRFGENGYNLIEKEYDFEKEMSLITKLYAGVYN